jgi:hypothetical protein
MRTRLPLLAVVLLLGLCPSAARAWNSTGHEVVAQIAWRELKPAARAKVLAILKEHPHFASLIEPSDVKPEEPTYAERSFMHAAVWPDRLRTARNKSERDLHRPEWHYVNNPIIFDGTDRATLELPALADKAEAGKPPANILQAMEWATALLKNADAPAADRAIALAWLEHLVGDLHQPLHACALFGRSYPRGDRGGNLVAVKYHGNLTNLHTFWDELLGGYVAPRLVAAVTDKVAEKYPRAAFDKELAATAFADWSAESFVLAREVVYGGGKVLGVTRDASAADKGATTPERPERYDETARETARRRVALAGYRLADLMNRILE